MSKEQIVEVGPGFDEPYLICPACDAPQQVPLNYPALCEECERKSAEASRYNDGWSSGLSV